MALPAQQYRTFRDLFRIMLSVGGVPAQDSDVLSFFKQLLADAAGAVALSSGRNFLCGQIFRRILSGNASNPTDADVVTFWTQFASDAGAAVAMGQTVFYRMMFEGLRGSISCDGLNPTPADVLGYFKPYSTVSFAALFPTAFQAVQTDLGLLYGAVPKATAGNTSTTVVALTGTIAGTPVPIWWKATNSASVGAGATFNIYYDGTGTTPAMTGVTPTAGTPVALTGAAFGMSATWTAGTGVNNDSWKATCSGLTDQSGNGNDYLQPTIASQPIVTIGVNGKPGLLFDGVDDLMSSACNCPVPGTTPWCGFLVARRPTTAAANARMISDGGDNCDLILTAATDIRLFNNGAFGPTGTGLATNTWGAIDYKYSNSAADYIQTGSGPVVTGAGAGNAASAGRQLGGNAAPVTFEVLAAGYVPATGFSSAAFRGAVTSLYTATVNV